MKILLISLICLMSLFGESESFYKEKYDFYVKKEEKAYIDWQSARDKSFDTFMENRKMQNLRDQISMTTQPRDRNRIEEEQTREVETEDNDLIRIENEEKQAYIKFEEYGDKIMELSFTIKEKLGILPPWFVSADVRNKNRKLK